MDPEILADALDCFWNAAIGAAHEKQDSTVFAVVGCIAEGVQAVSNRLREHGKGCDNCGAKPIRDTLDGDALCQACCDKWARAQGED